MTTTGWRRATRTAGLAGAAVATLAALLALVGPVAAADPDLGWVAHAGATGTETAEAVAVDGAGNVITAGSFEGTVDFDPGPGTLDLTSAGGLDVFVQKLDSAGNLIWVVRVGGSWHDRGEAIAVDGAGNVHITGSYQVTVDFDPGPGTFNLTASGVVPDVDAFVLKLDAAGEFAWATSAGSADFDQAYAVAVDSGGNVFTTGYFEGTADFDPGPGTTALTSAGDRDVFLQKLDAAGDLVWAARAGGTHADEGLAVTVDSAGNVITTGSFSATVDFDPGPGTHPLTSVSGTTASDVFVQKLNAAGDLEWAVSTGGAAGGDEGRGVAVDADDNVVTVGAFQGVADFDPGPGTATIVSGGFLSRDMFVWKLDSGGNLIWARRTGSWGIEQGHAVAVDGAGSVITTGLFARTVDFDPGPGLHRLTATANYDSFVQKLDAAGDLVWAVPVGTDGLKWSHDVAGDAAGRVFTTGFFEFTVDFDPGPGIHSLTSAGSRDAFVQKLVEPDPVITPGVGVVEEGDTGSVVMDVVVRLSSPSPTPVTVDWITVDTGGPGVAAADIDYASGSGTVTFAPGETEATVPLTVFGDTLDEPPALYGEWILVAFSNPSPNATLDLGFFGLGLGIIVDDDP